MCNKKIAGLGLTMENYDTEAKRRRRKSIENG
jgi:hypothetical protein